MKKIVKAEHFSRRPPWIQALNRAWRSLYAAGAEIKLDKDRLIRTARRRCDLQDLGPDFWDEPLERLIRSMETEAQLNPLGRFISRERLVNLLCVRLRAEDWFKKYPEILEQDLYPTLIIAGLQRTGTTKLQRLLSLDPGNRLVMSWEALHPAPIGKDPQEKKRRIRKARLSENALRIIAPDFFAIHPVEHLAPEEDVLLLDAAFMSTTAEAIMDVPAYGEWLERTDQSPAYAYAIKLLKLLQWQHPGKRWVLKSPHHMEFFGEIHRLLPHVHFVWTHRDLNTCIPSFLSMVAHGRAIFSDEVNLHRVAGHWTRKIGYMLRRGTDFRRRHQEALFTDIHYPELLAAPVDTIRRIYEKNALPFSPDLEKKLTLGERDLQLKQQGKYHGYAMEDFDLSPAIIHDLAKPYLELMEKIS